MNGRRMMEFCSGLQHVGIPTADVEATCAFYEGLGFLRTFEDVIGNSQKAVFLQSGNLLVEIYEGEPVLESGAVDHIAVDCLDVEAAYELACTQGYKIVSRGIEELPFWENGVRFFMIEGPCRERIEFNQKF